MFQCSKQGAVDVIDGAEPLTGEQVEALAGVLQQCLRHGQPQAVLDLHQVSLIHSAGLELLLEMQRDFARRGGALKLAAPNPLCQDILDITGLAGQFEIYREVKSAVGSFLQ